MAKFIIVDNDGNILRAMNIQYEGIHIDLTDMNDQEFQDTILTKQQTVKVDMAGKFPKRDHRGLPIIIPKEEK